MEEEEEPECLGLINIAYGEICEFCIFREVCEEIAKELEEIERRIQENITFILLQGPPGVHPLERKGAIEALKYVLDIIKEEREAGES